LLVYYILYYRLMMHGNSKKKKKKKTVCSETSAHIIQTPGYHPTEEYNI